MKKGLLFVIALGFASLSQANVHDSLVIGAGSYAGSTVERIATPYNKAIAFDFKVSVSPVSSPLSKPVPAIIWSFGLGMAGLLALAKCRKSV